MELTDRPYLPPLIDHHVSLSVCLCMRAWVCVCVYYSCLLIRTHVDCVPTNLLIRLQCLYTVKVRTVHWTHTFFLITTGPIDRPLSDTGIIVIKWAPGFNFLPCFWLYLLPPPSSCPSLDTCSACALSAFLKFNCTRQTIYWPSNLGSLKYISRIFQKNNVI